MFLKPDANLCSYGTSVLDLVEQQKRSNIIMATLLVCLIASPFSGEVAGPTAEPL